MQQVDSAELSWDQDSRKWLLRIRIGEEVIRRKCTASKDAGEAELGAIAEQTARDDGYDLDPARITIAR
jgi:hypothetical protein